MWLCAVQELSCQPRKVQQQSWLQQSMCYNLEAGGTVLGESLCPDSCQARWAPLSHGVLFCCRQCLLACGCMTCLTRVCATVCCLDWVTGAAVCEAVALHLGSSHRRHRGCWLRRVHLSQTARFAGQSGSDPGRNGGRVSEPCVLISVMHQAPFPACPR